MGAKLHPSNVCALIKVNLLLTMSIKVNTLCICRIFFDGQGLDMKKQAQTKVGFWSWLLGYGTGSGGTQG